MAIARIALPVASHSLFDYWLPPGLDAGPGCIVRVHLARRPIRTPADTHPHDPAIEKILLDLHKLFHLEMIDRGYYLARRGFIALSLPTTEADAENFASAVGDFLDTHGAMIERTLPAGI